jgi:para-nitrobenzyl esterase
MNRDLSSTASRAIDRRFFINSAMAGLVAGSSAMRSFGADAKSSAPGSVVDTTSGKIRGTSEGRIQAFKGVPYGAPTGGSARFMPPAKPKPWTGVKDTVTLGLRCPQGPSGLVPEWGKMDREEPSGEDCLCLNVWTAGLKDGGKRPVMVWLHGGGFSSGSDGFTCYDGTNLALNHDVVVVGINHRLNVFGFLYLADIGGEQFAHSTNIGMLDIVAALEWVRDNIANFGGDPANVTIFGQSGGGGKVSTLLAMPAATGLFHRAIAQSGVNLKGVSRADATKTAELILAKLNLKPAQAADLRKLPADQLVSAIGGGAAGNPALRLAPVVDGHTLPADPFDPVAPKVSANVPLMIGSTETEITFRANTKYDPLDDAALHARVKQDLHLDDTATDRLISVYKKGRPKSDNLDLYLILASDNWLRVNVNLEAERKAALGAAPVYTYYFTWRSPVRGGQIRSMHTMDIPFVFDNVEIAKVEVGSGSPQQVLASRMSAAWAAFARSGNPNTKNLPSWPAYDAKKRATMIFDNQCNVANDPHGEERAAMAAAMKV